FAPEVFQSADGRCIINWTDASISSEGFGCQLITREGEPVWDENGISLVSGMIGDVENPVLFSNMNGEFGIVWLDSRNTTKNPFFQFGMDNEDSVQFTFADNGMSIFNSDSLKMVETVDAVKNIDDGFIITWTESDRESRNNKGYVQRFSAQGESMWNENGIQCSLENQDLNESLICSDNNGGAYVVWSESEEDIIFIQRISSDGEYQFQRDGVHLSADGGRSLPMDIIEDGEGGCVVLWQQTLYDDGGWGVFAQRVNQDGSLIWEEGGLEVNHLDEERPNPRILKHPQGFFFLWQDDRDGEEERFGLDIYCQFVDTEGNILWMEEGELICDYGEDHDDPVMAVDNDGFIWIGWEDHRSEFENGTDLYIQKIYMDIEFPDLEFDSRGYELVAEQYNQHSLQLEHDGQNGLWAVWVEDNLPYGEQGDLYAIHLDPDGRRYEPWDRGGNLICGAPLKQEKPQIARLKENGETGIVVAWIDGRSFDDMTQQNYNLYSQRIDDDFYTDGVKKRNGQTMTPMDFSITGTYPNPFNSTILIGYSLPVQAFVSLNVYNINGQLINTLFEGHQKSGFRNTCFNANNLPSGTYFLRMETSDQMFTRKISLIR
ncbi:T9SS type A sorting domain-containing protein, partial [bacterium]|nr:T9SS type A sorting domain-containing protein [bacterium]